MFLKETQTISLRHLLHYVNLCAQEGGFFAKLIMFVPWSHVPSFLNWGKSRLWPQSNLVCFIDHIVSTCKRLPSCSFFFMIILSPSRQPTEHCWLVLVVECGHSDMLHHLTPYANFTSLTTMQYNYKIWCNKNFYQILDNKFFADMSLWWWGKK